MRGGRYDSTSVALTSIGETCLHSSICADYGTRGYELPIIYDPSFGWAVWRQDGRVVRAQGKWLPASLAFLSPSSQLSHAAWGRKFFVESLFFPWRAVGPPRAGCRLTDATKGVPEH